MKIKKKYKKLKNKRGKSSKKIFASTQFDRASIDIGILRKDQINEPAEERTTGEFVDGKWARFFDNNSTFLYELRQLTQNSATLGRILEDKARLAMGSGFNVVESKGGIPFLASLKRMLTKLRGKETAVEIVNKIIGSVNLHSETLEEVGYKLNYDFAAFGNAVAELIRTTKDGKPVIYINHVPLEYVGVGIVGPLGVSEKIAIQKEWIKGQSPAKENIVSIYPNWTVNEEVDENGKVLAKTERTVIHVKNYLPGFEYWGLPSWIAARYWAEIEYRIPKYNISKFKNGFTPSAIVQFFGSATKEEAQQLIKDFRNAMTDTGNNSKIIAQVLRDERFKVNIETLEDKNDGNYMDLSKLAAQNIVTATRWTMALAGHATAGKLGTNQQVRDELEIITNMCIKPQQSVMLGRVFNPFLKEYAEYGKQPQLSNIFLTIANNNVVSFASKIDANTNLTTNEKREALGYDSLTQEQIEEENNIQNATTTNTDTGTGGN